MQWLFLELMHIHPSHVLADVSLLVPPDPHVLLFGILFVSFRFNRPMGV